MDAEERELLLARRERDLLEQMNINPDGEIDALDVGICWNLNWQRPDDESRGPAARDVRVIDWRRAVIAGADAPQCAADRRDWERAASTLGACLSDWMINPRSTPEGVFAGLLIDGHLPTGKALGPVLKEFSRIRECAWARRMLVGLMAPDMWLEDGHSMNF